MFVDKSVFFCWGQVSFFALKNLGDFLKMDKKMLTMMGLDVKFTFGEEV